MTKNISDILMILIGCLLSGIGTVLVMQFSAMRKNLEKISDSVGDLNTQIAVVIKDQSWHKKEMIDTKDIADRNSRDIVKNKERLHYLEGGQSQLLEHLKTN